MSGEISAEDMFRKAHDTWLAAYTTWALLDRPDFDADPKARAEVAFATAGMRALWEEWRIRQMYAGPLGARTYSPSEPGCVPNKVAAALKEPPPLPPNVDDLGRPYTRYSDDLLNGLNQHTLNGRQAFTGQQTLTGHPQQQATALKPTNPIGGLFPWLR